MFDLVCMFCKLTFLASSIEEPIKCSKCDTTYHYRQDYNAEYKYKSQDWQRDILKSYYLKKPYIETKDVDDLRLQTCMPRKTIRTWFQNERKKDIKH